ncbi:sigma-54 dependent transcriptional regulator [Halomonas sp. NO4]|uniref:sigma-54 interaction domain-containing protein n=1 Tax=Halomonas sp. NO4 TaxID=2484813 RepID=UPI0013D7150A|nr:sigma-54 dependent transcriptional regulator [Halomonas sp. NO4]
MDEKYQLLSVGNLEKSHPLILETLKEQGWNVDTSNTFSDSIKKIEMAKYDVGLVLINGGATHAERETEKCLTMAPINWVAILKADLLEDSHIHHLLRRFFYAYYPLPGNADQLACLLKHAARMTRLQDRVSQEEKLHSDEYEMVGTTPSMKQLFDTIRRVAAVDAPVFINGESGTGKELAAHAIHERSERCDGPFVAVNCGALPTNLIQSELFGHEKGAFTGASHRKIGRIEAAEGGTLFLDEIGDLPLDMQVNLLRFLEDHHIQRVGSTKEITVDVRILAATHVDLDKAVLEGRFREDLYHRLNVLQIHLPALRDRQEDIEVLARFFFDKFANEKSIQVKGFSQEALRLMQCYSWPGNIRELINRVRRALVMCETRLIGPADLGLERRHTSRHITTLEQARDQAEYEALISALGRNRYNIQNAARDLGVSRVTLYRLMEKHRINREMAAI